jgi:DMSO/TMAO reductase YedYZ molybdopterin-dependent catalytic subunit
MRKIIGPAVIGVLSAAFGVAVAELLAAATRPQAGPLVAVGGAVIDATPTPVKEFAVRELGNYDKPVLLGSIALVLAIFTAVVGILAVKRRWIAVAGAAIFGVAGAVAALSRPTASAYDAVPSVLGAAVAGGTLLFLLHRAYPRTSVSADDPGSAVVTPGGKPSLVHVDRRAFLRSASMVAGGAVLVGGGSEIIKRARGGAIADARAAIKLPAPAQAAAPLPAGVAAGFTTTNADFYRVDTALNIPRIDVDTWSLRIHGMVDKEIELSFDDLLKRPLIERDITLNCVSNEVGGPYIGTARWLGVPLAPLLNELGIKAGADQVVARSIEGMTIGTPVETVLDGRDTMLCVGMNGEPLPLVHGFPVRMLTPGLYGYAGACKWMTEIELTTFADFDAYWVRRDWGARGPVKIASRIDRPQPFAQIKAGAQTVAGVAWKQRDGIESVEVRVDDGPWQKADLLPVPSVDTWVQWRYEWTAEPGSHTLTVRATDKSGEVQTEKRVTPFPDGATGWHNVTATVA